MQSGTFDLVVIAQTIHHFSPGQLAKMIAEATRIAPGGFIGIDGYRSVATLGSIHLMGLAGGLRSGYPFWHDAFTNGRKFYCESELELIARIAAPRSSVSVRRIFVGFTVVETLPFRRN